MMSRIREIMEPSDIDYLISNHTEPDHSGSIKKFLQTATDTTLIATPAGKKGLQRYYGNDLTCTTTKDKPKVNLGARTLHFVPVPMVHWPDSMVTYIPEEKLLFSNDAFGQHLASSKRFDDEVDQSVLMYEAKTYYANIVMHLWGPIQRAFNTLKTIEVEMIAPSHGVVWRKRPGSILEAYKGWVDGLSEPRVVIVYDTMWGSTEMIANALMEGISQVGVDVQLYSLSATNSTEIIANILDARTVLIGSPTLNNGLFPTVSKFLTYMKGLKPRNKLGAAFGSFGWGGGAKREAEALLKSTGIEVVENDLDVNYRPNSEELERAKEFGKYIATKTLNE
jgi:flavorubredoxin